MLLVASSTSSTTGAIPFPLLRQHDHGSDEQPTAAGSHGSITEIMQVSGTAGASIGVLDGATGEVHLANFGHRDVNTQLPPDEHTIYHLASLSKSFTAVSIGILVADGKLKFSDRMCDVLPSFHHDDEDVATRSTADTDRPKSVLDSRGRPQSPRSAASDLGVGTQQRSDGRLSQCHDHRSDSDQTGDPEFRHPPVPDSGEQNEGISVVPPQGQESRASTPRSSDDENNNDHELADAQPPTQPSASRDRIDLRRNIDGHRNTDSEEEGRLVEDSVTDHDQNDEVVQPPRKRRKISTSTPSTAPEAAARRQTRQQSKRRQSQRNHPNPPSPPGSTSEEETVVAPVAKFEEWPLENAVLKRVTMDGSPPTFVVQFTWGPCAKHGMEHHGTENRGSVSSAKRHRPATQSTRYVKDKDTTANRKPTSTSRRTKYTPEDDAKIRQLKEQGLSWLAIAEQFPGRTPGAIEVRYHTKLKTTKTSRSWARQLRDSPPTPSVADDAGEEEWEPYQDVADTEALDEGERHHAETNIWEVDRLLGKWTRGRTTWYLVRWARFGDEHNTWEERKDIGAELVAEYEAGYEGNDFAIQWLLGKRTRCGRTEYLVEWKGLESETTWETEADICRIRIREFETNQ